MYGKWVTLDLDDGFECKVYVLCSPNTPDEELQDIAERLLRSKLGEPKKGIMALGNSLRIIKDFEKSIPLKA